MTFTPASKTIWLIRHAENSKEDGCALTDKGKIAAADLARQIAKIDRNAPTFIFTSNLERGASTGKILRDVFRECAKECFHIENNYLVTRDDNDLIQLVMTFHSLDEQAALNNLPSPSSVILIGHKNYDQLQILSALLDPEGYATDYKIGENQRRSQEQLEELGDLSLRQIIDLYPESVKPLQEMAYLEAQQYRFLPQRWSQFHAGCARYERTLTAG